MPRSLDDARSHAEGLLYTTQKLVEKYGYLVPDARVADVWAAMQDLGAAIEGEDAAVVERLLFALVGAGHRFLDAIRRAIGVEMEDEPVGMVPKELAALVSLLWHVRCASMLAGVEIPPIGAVVDRELGVYGFTVEETDGGLASLASEMRAGALRGEYIATGTCAVVADIGGQAFSFRLDHVAGASLVVIIPYWLEHGHVRRGEPRVLDGAHDVFPS